jgi:hypothetical protein
VDETGKETRLRGLLDETEVAASVLLAGQVVPKARFSPEQRADLDALTVEVKRKTALLRELRDVLSVTNPGYAQSEGTANAPETRLQSVKNDLEAESLQNDQLLFLHERSHASLQRLKAKTHAAKATISEIQARLEALTEEVTAVELDTALFRTQTHKLQVSAMNISLAVENRRVEAHFKVLTQHSETTKTIQQTSKETTSKMKTKLHLQRLQQRLNAQKSIRIRILMCEGVLEMANLKLKGRFSRLADAFKSENVQEIIEKVEGARLQTARYASEVQDRLLSISKLLKTLKDLRNNANLTQFSGNFPTFSSDFPKYREITQARRVNIAVSISVLSGLLAKIRSADFPSRLCAYSLLPDRIDTASTVAMLFLQLEKAILAARDGGRPQRTVKSSKMGQMVLTMKVMLGGLLVKSNRGSIRKRTLKSLYSPQTLTGAESPVISSIRAKLHANKEDLCLSVNNEEHFTAISERKAYHLLRLHTPTPLSSPKQPSSPLIRQSARSKELDKLRGELAKARKTPLIRTVASEELLEMRKSARKLMQPLRIPMTNRTEVESPIDEAVMKWPRRTISPSSSTSTKGTHMPSPRGNYSSRLRRLAGF